MKCKKCNQQFYHKRVRNEFCSLRCSGVVSPLRRKEGLNWPEMWDNFWVRYYSLSLKSRDAYLRSLLDLMPETYVNNKGEVTHDLFKPNNIQL